MALLFATVFIASLLGSLHCVGMCGPFALIAAADPRRNATIVPTIAYSGGRLITYSIVGMVFGTLGMALNQGIAISTWQQSATYLAGGAMIVVGLISMARYFGWHIALPKFFSPAQRILQQGFARTKSLPPFWRALSIGALTSLMPCGWLYTFAITAAGTGSPLWGMALMIVFWAGTVPIMTALMLGYNRIGTPIQKRLPILMAGLVTMIGIFTIAYRAPVTVDSEATAVTGVNNLRQQVIDFDQHSLPCCGGDQGEEE